MRFWFPPAVVQGLRRLCGGLCFSWHPCLPHPFGVISLQWHLSRGRCFIMRLQNNQSCVFIVSRLRYALDSSSSFPCRLPRFGGLATTWNRGATLRPCPHFAIEPDEPPTWAGEQHRQCSRLKDPGRPVRSLGTHRVLHLPLRPL